MKYPGRRRERDERPRRRFSPLWALFWLILLIVLLGLVFGGYRKGTPIHNPGDWMKAAAALSSTG
jgi:hypothetical protein